jgi:uncharacterized protein YuzE
MKVEYDSVRDLIYIWFGVPGEKAARTETVVPGVHADFNAQGRLIGIEVLDASEVLRHKVQFEVELTPSLVETTVV